MKAQKIKVSAVSYLNTLPFLYGINNSEVINEIDLSLDIPSDCAKKLLDEEVDLGLVPVAILPELKEYHIISDYCIGAEGKVDSVALFSDVPLDEIESVYLDYQSKTSVTLVKILAKKLWKINPKWVDTTEGYENKIEGKTAGVVIGDRTFNLPKPYHYKYDLSEEWFKLTGLPFTFACWVSNKELSELFIQSFNQALKEGVNNIDEAILNHKGNTISKESLKKYLTQNISYLLDDNKKMAIEEFLKFIETKEVLNSEY
jgi:chorismate dehydratase